MNGSAVSFRKSLVVLVLMMLGSLVLVQAPHVDAGAVTISLSSTQIAAGESVTAKGFGATENGNVYFYLSGSVFLATTTANETGGYSTDFIVPSIPAGTYALVVVDSFSGGSGSVFFTIKPKITLARFAGAFGDKIAIAGDGFAVGRNVTMRLSAVNVTPNPIPQTDRMGSFQTEFSVPSMPNGPCDLRVSDDRTNSANVAFNVIPEITLQPTSGNVSSFVAMTGHGFAPSKSVTVLFDLTDVTSPSLMTAADGSLSVAFFVPDVSDGTYFVEASDALGNIAFSPFTVPSPVLTLTPDRTVGGSLVTVHGEGFQQYLPIVFYLEKIMTTGLVDFIWQSETLLPNRAGSINCEFVVPVTKCGEYTISAFQATDESPSNLTRVASATLIVSEDTSLGTDLSVGEMHFRGELAEFYLKTTLNGQLVNAQLEEATLYYSNGTAQEDLLPSVTTITAGLYRIPFQIDEEAPFGSYTLLACTSYQTVTTSARGTASASFLVSPTFSAQNAQILSMEGDIATIIVPDLGTIKANLTSVHAKLTSIEGNVATIQSDLGALKTNAAAIHAKVTSIEGGIATVSSDIGTVKLQMANAGVQMNSTISFALIAALGAAICAFALYRRAASSSSGSPRTKPPLEKPKAPAKSTEQLKKVTQSTASSSEVITRPQQSRDLSGSSQNSTKPISESKDRSRISYEPTAVLVVPPESVSPTDGSQVPSHPEKQPQK